MEELRKLLSEINAQIKETGDNNLKYRLTELKLSVILSINEIKEV